MNLRPLFNPRTIAVVGASRDRSKLGNVIFRNCTRFGFRGKVFAVNPKAQRVEGQRAYSSLTALPRKVDLVIVVTPAAVVPAVIVDAVRAKARSAVVISAGFGETGEQGKKLQQQVIAIAKRGRLPLLGPNCLGIVLPHLKLNASFGAGLPTTGGVTILSQSGAIAVAEMDWAASKHLGFRAIVSLGNKAMLGEVDLLEYFAADPGTKVILFYLEDIRDGRLFMQVAQRVAAKKPIIVLRAGRSVAAAKAAQSHTGALAGSSVVTDALLRQAGCIVVDTMEEWFNLAAVCSNAPRPKGNRLAILTNAGGPGILATDALAGTVLQLAQLSKNTLQKLQRVLPAAAAIHNPVDVIGDAPPERYAAALKILAIDPHVDILVLVLTEQLTTRSTAVAKAVIAIARKSKKPILTSFIGGAGVSAAVRQLQKANIPTFPFPEAAVKAAHALVVGTRPSGLPIRILPASLAPFRTHENTAVGEQARKFLSAGGITVLPSFSVKSADHAVRVATRLRFPAVIKLDAAKVLHKTDRGAVAVDLYTPAMVRTAYLRFAKKFKVELKKPESHIVIQDQRSHGVEVFLGAIRDPQFGPIIVLGFGGIYVEALRSVTYACAPMTLADAKVFLERSKVWAILRGVRGQTFANDSLQKLIVNLSNFIAVRPEVQSVDCNPVLVSHSSATIIDARLTFIKI
ncbi:MAG: acetate--CoA ligase family protein [bacterium]|nr:acetate--CoA ligase family protein [bacterium]